MASPENIRLHVSVNGGAPQTGAVEVEPGDVIALSLNNTSGVQRAVYRIWECPEDFGSPPAGWTAESIGYSVTTTNGAPAPMFTMPSHWGKYLLSVEVNERRRSGKIAQDLFDNSSLVYIESLSGVKDICNGETTQADPIRGYAGELKRTLRTIDGALGGVTGVSLPANPTDDGKLAYASGGNLAYSSLTYDADNGRLYLPVNHAIYGETGGGGASILHWGGGNILSIGHQATTSVMRVYADSFLFQLGTFGSDPGVVLDYDGLQLPSGLELVLDDAHLLKNGDYLWSILGDVGFPLGPFEVPDDISDTTIDVGAAHVGRRNRCTAGTAVTLALEEESTQPIGSYVHFTQVGDGQLEFVPGDGVTTLTPETLKSRKKGSTISAYRVTATHWDITGDLELDA